MMAATNAPSPIRTAAVMSRSVSMTPMYSTSLSGTHDGHVVLHELVMVVDSKQFLDDHGGIRHRKTTRVVMFSTMHTDHVAPRLPIFRGVPFVAGKIDGMRAAEEQQHD